LDGLLSLVRGESADSDPGDPQDGWDQFARLLKLVGLGLHAEAAGFGNGRTKPVSQPGAAAFFASFQVARSSVFLQKSLTASFVCTSFKQTWFVFFSTHDFTHSKEDYVCH
jgi:hypothetical protein